MGQRFGGSRLRRPRLPAWARRRQVALVVLISVGITASSMLSATHAAFTASTSASGNIFTTGSVSITDNDAGSAILSLTGIKPGDSSSSCIKVTYSGALPALVKLYRNAGGTGLASYLDVTLTRGSISSGGFGDCTGFTPDAADYLGQGAGVIYESTLGGFPTAVGAALDDPRAVNVPEVWTAGETHAYKFTATLQEDTAAQGLTATGGLVWQAVNVSDYSQVVFADEPVGYWRLDEAGGTTAVDATGNGHDGTYTNGPVLQQVSGVKNAGSAVTFDGNDDRVHIPYTAALNPSTFTVEAWAKATGGSGWGTVASSFGARNEGFGLWDAQGNAWQMWASGPAGETEIGAALTPNTWAHVVGTYDGTTMRLYVDGQLVNSLVHPYAPHTTAAFELGATSYDNGSFWGEHFTGSIDEVAVYDRVLTAQEISEHYTAGRP